MLNQYDRILRQWILQPSLNISELKGKLVDISRNLSVTITDIRNPHWSHNGSSKDQLRIEVERFNVIERLRGDIELVIQLRPRDTDIGIVNAIDKIKTEIEQAYLTQRPIAEYCITFHNEVAVRKSLLLEEYKINQLRTGLINLIGTGNEDKDTYQPLRSWIETIIDQIITQRNALIELVSTLKNAGERDQKDQDSDRQTNYPADANTALMSLEKEDPQNILNWKEVLTYKSLDDYYDIIEKIQGELALIHQIKKHAREIERKILLVGDTPGEFQTAMDQAKFLEAQAIVLEYFFNLEDMEAIKLEHLSDIETLIIFIQDQPDLAERYQDSRVAKLLDGLQLIDRYDRDETLMEIDSFYIRSLLRDLSEKRERLNELINKTKSVLSNLAEQRLGWQIELDQLDVEENNYFNVGRGIFSIFRKQRRIEIVNQIHEVLNHLDEIAPNNNFTEEKRRQWN